MVQEHRIMFRAEGLNPHTPPDKRYIIHPVLEYFLKFRITKNALNNPPNLKFNFFSRPITSSHSSSVDKRYNDCFSFVRSEAHTCDLASSCLNINRKDR